MGLKAIGDPGGKFPLLAGIWQLRVEIYVSRSIPEVSLFGGPESLGFGPNFGGFTARGDGPFYVTTTRIKRS